MAKNAIKLGYLYSKRRQLFAGSIALLAIMLALISYFMIANEQSKLTTTTTTTVLSQGRNIAIVSNKPFLSLDPEYELIPLLKDMLAGNGSMTSIVITDADGVIVADQKLQNISEGIAIDWKLYEPVIMHLAQDELLGENEDTYLLKTPVRPRDETVGYVYMTYSKGELHSSILNAQLLIIIFNAAAFVVGLALSIFLFRRISEPMDKLIERVEQLSQASPAGTDGDDSTKPGGFNATFEAFSFVDLLQALGQSNRSCHISLTGGRDETAQIYLNAGNLIYADCDQLAGAEAIYRLLKWGEEGAFKVEPEDTFPETNIHDSTEGVLMEGFRRLDEAEPVQA